ncbi:MAG: efflux transporter periplasmic adaptor subunit [Rhodoferax ferrireducens]|uniref:Efflux transporter periplasmic adaptor subunit n=1 Tax=Rhodoferax ferrireducens TaxID=192843 RepID=A0A1W9KZB9_9BURK|nr:MAG: efflux transporter periplasmic adaptor subunit [Rhodoferax ferrireducens]
MNSRQLLLRRVAIGAAALALIGAVAYVSLRTGPLAPIKVTVSQPVEGSISPAIFGIGTVEARRSWLIGPTVAGRVLSVRVDVGDQVQAGQLLAEMDPVDLDQRLAALDASLARAGSSQLSAQAQVSDASARRALAAANTRRNQDLARQNFISAGALEAKLQEQASADAATQAAQANLAGAGQDLARIKAERAALAQQRGNVRLLAPASGVVTSRDAEAGSTVVVGQPVLRLIDPASLWVKLRVDQGRSAGLATGLAGSIVLRSQPQTTLSGQVARLELLADPVTEERMAQVAFTQMPAHVSVGEMAEVTLQLPATAPTLLLPNAAIQRQQGQTGVWRLAGDQLEFAPVKLGVQSLDGQVQVLQGLAKENRVVIYSEKMLQSGSRIKVVDTLVKTGAKP